MSEHKTEPCTTGSVNRSLGARDRWPRNSGAPLKSAKSSFVQAQRLSNSRNTCCPGSGLSRLSRVSRA